MPRPRCPVCLAAALTVRGAHLPKAVPQMHQLPGAHAYSPTISDCGSEGLMLASKLLDGSSVSCGCWRADRDIREAARMTMLAWGLMANRGPRATAGRQAEPALPFQPGVPPAARWGGGPATAGW